MVLFIVIVGGGGAQNDAYQRLEQFIHLEAVGQLETARAHPENYDSMLQIDFTAFKDSHEFKNYIKEHDSIIDQAVAIGIGWLFVFLSEVVLLLINLVTLILKRKQS